MADTERPRNEWGNSEQSAIKFLERRGYYLTSYWMWLKPDRAHKPTPDELAAVEFLQCSDGHYGGIYIPRDRA
jgi:hypothetical protein